MKNSGGNFESQALAAIILAAGNGSRFGGGKLMARLPNGERIIDVVMKKTVPIFDEYCCVVRRGDVELQHYLDQNQWRWVVADHAHEGMSQSLISGVDVFPNAAAWLFILADMPYVRPSTLVKLKKSLQEGSYQPSIVIPCCRGKVGNPVGLSGHFKLELEKLTGDVGARSIVTQYRDAQRIIDVEDEGILQDIDHPNDMVTP